MAVYGVIGGSPKFENGLLDPGGGDELERIRGLKLTWKPRPTTDGTMTTALKAFMKRDATQGIPGDLTASKHLAGSGRCEKNIFKLTIIFVDDVRRGRPAEIGRFVLEKTYIKSLNTKHGVETIETRSSHFSYFNTILGRDPLKDDGITPVIVHGFVDEDDSEDGSGK